MEKTKPNLLKGLINIIILEASTLVLLIIAVTVIRFAMPSLFSELKAVYEKYVLVETDISLVLGGEEDDL